MESLQCFKHGPTCALEKSLWLQCAEWIGWGKTGSRKVRYAMAASQKHSETLGEIPLTIFYDTSQENIFMDP